MQTRRADASGLFRSGVAGVTVNASSAPDQFELASRFAGYATSARYRMRGSFLFNGIPLAGAHVLDVGCGRGAWSLWAALHDAAKVVGIEPGADGSSVGSLEVLRRSIATLGIEERLEARSEYLNELPRPDVPYDVVIMHNVINHFDEEAVIVLDHNQQARKRYVSLLQDLRSRVHAGSWLIVADCARHNLWPRLGLTSPFVPSIEWNKHQDPDTWIGVFSEAGFRYADLRWSPLQPFPRITANWLVQYLTCSHFVLRFQSV